MTTPPERPAWDAEALVAALTVDRRKAEIRRRLRAEQRLERDTRERPRDRPARTYYERDDGFDRPPPRLTRDQLKAELGDLT